MAEAAPPHLRHQDRQDAILDAAFHAFATYGFRRASMDDIARGAGMSRSALYLHYRNKEDIFRSLAQRHFAEAEAAVAAALAADGPATGVIEAFFIAKDGKFMEVVLGTPHGSELLDAGFSVSADIAAVAEARMLALLAGWMATRGVAAGLGTPAELATTLMAALRGVKETARDLTGYRAEQARLARIFARALENP